MRSAAAGVLAGETIGLLDATGGGFAELPELQPTVAVVTAKRRARLVFMGCPPV